MTLKTFLTSFLFVAIATLTIKAGPADPSQTKTITLDNGTTKVVRLMGDEYGSYWKALDNSGCYRMRSDETNRYEEVNEAEMIQLALEQRRNSIFYESTSAQNYDAPSRKKVFNSTRSSLGLPCTNQNLIGNKRVLVILVSFKDKTFSPENATSFNDIFNATNYHEDRYSGSVKDYFLAQSNGLLNLQFDIVGPVTVSQKSAYYGKQTSSRTDAHPWTMAMEAVSLVDDSVDFSRYDWDNDGVVEHLIVLYAGLSQSEGGIEDDVWPHQGSMASFCDRTIISTYACASEQRKIGGENRQSGIGSICHELSHCFGLADSYDLNNTNYGMNFWDIMDVGMHLDKGFTPAGYTAFGKMFCRWQTPIILKDNQNVTNMKPLSQGGDFYLIPNDGWDDEFFLLENRQKTGCDTKLYRHGMLITHLDFDKLIYDNNMVNTTGKKGDLTNDHERMSIVSAGDSHYTLQDLYPHSGNDSLTNTSTPNTQLFHKNIDDTYLLSKSVKNIRENGDKTMNFTFTNNIGSQNCHLTDINGKIRVTSSTSAKLVVSIKNNGDVNYSRKIAAFVYVLENGSYKIQTPRDTHDVSLAVGETKECEFTFNGLKDNKKYYVFLNFQKEENSEEWTQMGTAYPFNLNERNKFNITMDVKGMTVERYGDSVIIKATFHNDNYRTYSRNIGIYTYFMNSGGYSTQPPRAFVKGDIEPFGEKRLAFKLENMDPNKVYIVFFCFHPDDTDSWTKIGGPHLVNSLPRLLIGDVNEDGQVTISDATLTVSYINGIQSGTFNVNNADVNNDGEITISDVMLMVEDILHNK